MINVRRFGKYNVVGLMGLCVKFSVLAFLVEAAHAGYMLGAALAVEAVMLHNFAWHLRWTWRDRSQGLTAGEVFSRLVRFQCGNGAIALIANLVIMRILVAGLGMHYFAANLIATALAGLANFMLSEFVVFAVPARAPSCRT